MCSQADDPSQHEGSRGTGPRWCTQCGRKFKHLHGLRVHMIVHERERDEKRAREAKRSAERRCRRAETTRDCPYEHLWTDGGSDDDPRAPGERAYHITDHEQPSPFQTNDTIIEDPEYLKDLPEGRYLFAGRARDEILSQYQAQVEAADLQRQYYDRVAKQLGLTLDLEDTLVAFVKHLHREESIQGTIDPDPLLKEHAHEFLAFRPDLKA